MKAKKGEFNIRSYLIVLVLAMGIIVSLSSAYMSSASKYGKSQITTQEFMGTYNLISNITAVTGDLDSEMGKLEAGDRDSTTTFYGRVISMVKLVWGSAKLPIVMINGVITHFWFIPPIWGTVAGAIILILLMTGAVFLIMGNKG